MRPPSSYAHTSMLGSPTALNILPPHKVPKKCPKRHLFLKNKQKNQKKECNTRTYQEVIHHSTTIAQARLTSEFWWDLVL
jgi:hypothetical protein